MSEERDGKTGVFSRRRMARAGLTAVVGTAAAVLAATKAEAGYGACSISGCPCRGYMGNQWLCGNCGHQYQAHW